MSSDLQGSIVKITSSNPDTYKFGTGFVMYRDKQATYLLTCAHVVRDVGGPHQVKGGTDSAMVIAIGSPDGPDDVAVLKVEHPLDIPALDLRITGAIGSPFIAAGFQRFDKNFLIRTIRGTLGEQGGLESRGQSTRIKTWDLHIEDNYRLQPGYSGAPVFDETSGSVLGIVSYREGEQKGLAISIETLKEIWLEIPSDLFEAKQKNTSLLSSATTLPSGTRSSFRQVKIKALEERLANLVTDYEAANNQLNNALSEVDRSRLQRQMETLEREITRVERELSALQ